MANISHIVAMFVLGGREQWVKAVIAYNRVNLELR